MSENTRERIFDRLRRAGAETTVVPDVAVPMPEPLSRSEKLARFTSLMTAMRAEVYTEAAGAWIDRLKELGRERQWKDLVYGPGSAVGPSLEGAWERDPGGLPELVGYPETGIEGFKDRLFSADAGITTSIGAVADTGAVVLWPSPAEPRLMSLVPAVHICLVEADRIYSSLCEAMEAQGWADRMPTNALLISGPSKTADIEFTLVFGVHGPKEMIVIIKN